MESPGAGRPRRRLARIIAGALLALVAALALVLVTAVAALHLLDHPWLKQRIVSRVEAATGLQLDYQTAQVAVLSGLRLEGLVVRTPSPFQGVAPELLRVGSLEVQWSPGALLSGTRRVERVSVRDVAIALVADEAGPTSLTGLMGPEAPEPPPVEAPLGASQRVAALLASAPPFGKVEVSGVSLSYVRVRNGEVLERWSLRGLAAAVEAKHQDGGWKLFAEIGQTGTPLPLELSREGPAIPSALAQLELALSAEAGASAARARVEPRCRAADFRSTVHGPHAAARRGLREVRWREAAHRARTGPHPADRQRRSASAVGASGCSGCSASRDAGLGGCRSRTAAATGPRRVASVLDRARQGASGRPGGHAQRHAAAGRPRQSSGWTSTSRRSSSLETIFGWHSAVDASPWRRPLIPRRGWPLNSHSRSRASMSGGPPRFVFRRLPAN